MKNEEALFAALGEIDPALVTEAFPDTAVPENKRRSRRGLRPAILLAAAVLLLTAVGAGANEIRSRLAVRLRPADGWEEDSSEKRGEQTVSQELGSDYRHLFTIEQEGAEPCVTLSDEVMAKLSALEQETDRNASRSNEGWIENGMAYGFDTWREAADFLDCGVLTSPLLEQPPEEFRNNRIAVMYLDGESLGRPEKLVNIFGQNPVPSLSGDSPVWCNVSVRIPLNADACGMGFGGVSVPLSDEDGAEILTSAYVTPSGIEAQIVVYRWEHLAVWNGVAYFLHDSISYMLSLHGESPEAVEAVLRTVLDSMG